MTRTVALLKCGPYVVLDIDDVAAVVSVNDMRAGRRIARAALRALGLPGRDVRRLCGRVHLRYAPGAYAPRRGPGPARAAMPALAWTDALGFPAPAPVRLRSRAQVRRRAARRVALASEGAR